MRYIRSSGPSRICDEALGREREASEVAASQTGSGNVQFAGNSIGDRAQPAVENMRGRVPRSVLPTVGVSLSNVPPPSVLIVYSVGP